MDCYGIPVLHRSIPELDHWLRRRVCMYYLKPWRSAASRFVG
nr:hypothetical protein [Desulfogranum japonicum]